MRKLPQNIRPACASLALAVSLAFPGASPSRAQYTPAWSDGFDTSANTLDINFEYNLRQGGAPVPYVANVLNQASDYHQQLIGPTAPSDRLLLAGDGGSPAPLNTLVSPNYNFAGPFAGGILGKRVTLSMDVGAVVLGAPTSFVQAGISIGGNSALLAADDSAAHFGVRFIEDKFAGNLNFIQLFDGNQIVGNLLPNPADAGWLDLDLQINDPADGNPWDGVGSTRIEVYVNNSLVGSYTKGGGGYTGNYLTLEGSPNLNGFGLATHHFDSLTVWASPVPEPSALGLLGAALAARLMARPRRPGHPQC